MRLLVLAASALALTACASGNARKQAAAASTAPAAESLPAQTLAPGACGLFLWTRDEPRHFVFFFPAGGTKARAVLNGQQADLSVISQGGEVFAQFMTEMKMATPANLPVSLSLQPGEQIEGGRRVPSARMISMNAEGWEVITPLSGTTACQPE